MRTIYFDCGMGAAGDMLTAALLGVLPKPQDFVDEFNCLGIPNVRMELEQAETCGIRGLRVHILVRGREEGDGYDCSGHESRGITDVEAIIGGLPLSDKIRNNALTVYRSIAGAESKVHGRPVSEVHFHELGALDAISDIVAVCMLMERLSPCSVCASPVHVGSGRVKCAHGILPVPAPATAELLKSIPTYGGEIEGELCTPTGAALLRYFVNQFGPQPIMAAEAVGYGIGTKTFPAANCVRVFMGQSGAFPGTVEEIACNLDDMTGEAIGFALETLLNNGALDAYTVPIGMKKSRPGVMLCCLCHAEDTDRLSSLMLRHTTSLGVRITRSRRVVLERESSTVSTLYGDIRIKTAGGVAKPEYEDLARIARENNITLTQAAALVEQTGKD